MIDDCTPLTLFVGGPLNGERHPVPVQHQAVSVPLICCEPGSAITTTTYRRITLRDAVHYYERCEAFFHESIHDDRAIDALVDGYCGQFPLPSSAHKTQEPPFDPEVLRTESTNPIDRLSGDFEIP